MNYFRLHGNCIIVKGASHALIYDLFRSRTIGVSLQIAELYETEFSSTPYEKVLSKYAEFKDQIIELIDHLIDNDFGFFTATPDSFPPLDTTYRIKKRIYSCIIELDTKKFLEYEKLFRELIALDCSIFYLIIREKIEDPDAFKKLLLCFKESRATWVKVIFEEPYLSLDQLRYVTQDMRISYLIYGSPKNEKIEGRWWFEESTYKFHLIEYKVDLFDLDKKSEYGEDHFWPTQATFIESQDHNPFFNLKVCVSKKGDYKNDLSFNQSFGNFHSRSIKDLLLDEEFKKLWYISNDKIEKCKDCQYRYQCVSNSDFNREGVKYHKVHHCGFDPYSNMWVNS